MICNRFIFNLINLQNEYFRRYPQGLNPVELNDVVFSLHATVITAVTISQCFFFEVIFTSLDNDEVHYNLLFFIFQRGDQRVSTIARGIISVFFAIIMVTVIMASFGNLHWLDFLNYCSYIKLAITLIKYVPQAVMNFKRQSTSGWSIGNILLDFTGGTLSMLQMMLNSYNYSESYIRFNYNQMNLLPYFSRRLAINIRRSNQVWLGFVLCPL